MRYPFGIPLLLLAILMIGAAAIFMLTTHGGAPAIAFEGRQEVQCSGNGLVVTVHSFERQKISLGNITVLENNAVCTSNVPYLILNTQAVITCPGNFSAGNPYTLSFDSRILRVRC